MYRTCLTHKLLNRTLLAHRTMWTEQRDNIRRLW